MPIQPWFAQKGFVRTHIGWGGNGSLGCAQLEHKSWAVPRGQFNNKALLSAHLCALRRKTVRVKGGRSFHRRPARADRRPVCFTHRKPLQKQQLSFMLFLLEKVHHPFLQA